MRDIWRKHLAIKAARRKVMQEAMRDYDEKVHDPAMKALTEECAKVGHIRGRYWDNGLGYNWFYCSQCGARMEIQSAWPTDKVEQGEK